MVTDAEYIALANSDHTWASIEASARIEGVSLSDFHKLIVGKLISGDITPEGARILILEQYSVN